MVAHPKKDQNTSLFQEHQIYKNACTKWSTIQPTGSKLRSPIEKFIIHSSPLHDGRAQVIK
jgi:hypothetical protein